MPIEMLALIGVLMGLWRLNGTAATVAIYGSALMSPRHFALSAFILCAAVSMAVGTANGAASIIGLPLMMVGQAYHLPEGLLAGAVISGIYLGDRSSLVSSVLHMVARLSGSNPRAVFRRLAVTLVPAVTVSALLYWLTAPGLAGGGKVGAPGLAGGGKVSGPASVSISAPAFASATAHTPAPGPAPEAELGLPPAPAPAPAPARVPAPTSTSTSTSVSTSVSASGSRLFLDALKRGGMVSPALLLAPAFMMIMAALRVPILTNLTLNVLVAAVVAVVIQHASPAIVVRTALLGHHASDALPVAPVTAGGGLASMVGVLLVLISSTALSGILAGTGIFDAALGKWLSRLVSPRRILLATMGFSIATGMVAANQALSVVLPCTLLECVYREKRLSGLALAHVVSDSGVIVAPLVPWSVAALGPAAILGVSPAAYIPYAFLCWALPAVSVAWILVDEASYAPALAGKDEQADGENA
ncbi:MAG: Na+/H+ antiporter NhaC family protein [Thermodesulfobacteriota bacterium]